jgi:hypothetical protein
VASASAKIGFNASLCYQFHCFCKNSVITTTTSSFPARICHAHVCPRKSRWSKAHEVIAQFARKSREVQLGNDGICKLSAANSYALQQMSNSKTNVGHFEPDSLAQILHELNVAHDA